MGLFLENSCRLCTRAFCCKSCRLKHEQRYHLINTDCDLCIYGKIYMSQVPNESVMDHIQKEHMPAHCLRCNQTFYSVEYISTCKCPALINLSAVTPIRIVVPSMDYESPPVSYPFNKEEVQYATAGNYLTTSTPVQPNDNKDIDINTPEAPSNLEEKKLLFLQVTSLKKENSKRVTFGETSIIEESKKSNNTPEEIKSSLQSDKDEAYATSNNISQVVDDEKSKDESVLWQSAIGDEKDMNNETEEHATHEQHEEHEENENRIENDLYERQNEQEEQKEDEKHEENENDIKHDKLEVHEEYNKHEQHQNNEEYEKLEENKQHEEYKEHEKSKEHIREYEDHKESEKHKNYEEHKKYKKHEEYEECQEHDKVVEIGLNVNSDLFKENLSNEILETSRRIDAESDNTDSLGSLDETESPEKEKQSMWSSMASVVKHVVSGIYSSSDLSKDKDLSTSLKRRRCTEALDETISAVSTDSMATFLDDYEPKCKKIKLVDVQGRRAIRTHIQSICRQCLITKKITFDKSTQTDPC